MDIVPCLIDGAVVLTLEADRRKATPASVEEVFGLSILLHNWVRSINLEYLIFDFAEEKFVPPDLIQEVIQLRKRKRCPMLFAGVMEQAQIVLKNYNCDDDFPIFVAPEDAVRALRMQYPGLTEAPLHVPIDFGKPLFLTLQHLGEFQLPRMEAEEEVSADI